MSDITPAVSTNDVEIVVPERGETEDAITTNDVEPIPEEDRGGAEAPAPEHTQHASKKAH